MDKLFEMLLVILIVSVIILLWMVIIESIVKAIKCVLYPRTFEYNKVVITYWRHKLSASDGFSLVGGNYHTKSSVIEDYETYKKCSK